MPELSRPFSAWLAAGVGRMLVGRDVAVNGTSMHYVESGAGRPVLFLHGNPTSSYLWRHVMPKLDAPGRRLVAVDLIGMGNSGKPDIGYGLGDHVAYVSAFIDALDLTDLTIVGHDWGVAIGLTYLRDNPDRVRAVALMEGHLRPLAGWDGFDEGGRELFQRLRTPGVGERLALEENFLIETLLPAAVRRPLTAADMAAYRRPYPDPASRRPLLQWTREIPVAGRPPDVAHTLETAWHHLARSPVPKLLVRGRPGAIVDDRIVEWCRSTMPDLEVADIGDAGHFLPEDQPDALADALRGWLDRPRPRSG
jgi:haloalkane dehalogenase